MVREYLNRKLLAKADEESVDLIERAIGVLRKLGATVVDPGTGGRAVPALHFAVGAGAAEQRRSPGKTVSCFRWTPQGSRRAIRSRRSSTCARIPSRVPEALTLRTLGGGFGEPGEDKYMINRYLRERGDANIKTNADLIAKATFYTDPNFPEPAGCARAGRARARRSTPPRACTRASRCRRC